MAAQDGRYQRQQTRTHANQVIAAVQEGQQRQGSPPDSQGLGSNSVTGSGVYVFVWGIFVFVFMHIFAACFLQLKDLPTKPEMTRDLTPRPPCVRYLFLCRQGLGRNRKKSIRAGTANGDTKHVPVQYGDMVYYKASICVYESEQTE